MSLQDKLEQEQLKLSQNVADRKALEGVGDGIATKIESLMDEIADTEVTYSRGDRFTSANSEYALSFTGFQSITKEVPTVGLTDLKDGGTWKARTIVEDCCRISSKEFTLLCGDRTFTRIWDSRKQEKV
jgi:hypothetical protein